MPNLYEEHARELLGLGPEFHLAKWESLDFDKVGKFAQAPLLADGEIAWKYEVKGSRKKVTFTLGEHHAWVKAWELRTGLCSGCSKENPGQVWMGWNVNAGHRYAVCQRCKGTNRSPLVEEGECTPQLPSAS
jgi:hypothetical protein